MAALATDLLGCTGSRIEALAKQDTEWQQILERFRDYLDLWLQRGFIQMFRSFMQREQVRPRLLAFPDRRTPADQPAAPGGGAPPRQHRRAAGRLRPAQVDQRAAGGAGPARTRSTSSGWRRTRRPSSWSPSTRARAWNTRWCSAPSRGKARISSMAARSRSSSTKPGDGALVRDLGSPDYEAHRQLARVERLAENVRLLYVALTRAKHRCYFVWGAFKEAETSARRPAAASAAQRRARRGYSPEGALRGAGRQPPARRPA